MTDALVLKTSPYSESTLIVWLLTREEGVARVLAKGARRMKGQNSAAFDLFAHLRVQLRSAPGDRLGMLRSADLRHEWPYLRRDLKRFALACLAMEALGGVAQISPHEPWFYEEAMCYLTALEGALAPGSMTGALLLRLLHHAGHPPRLDEALDGARLPERIAYDFEEGMLTAAPEFPAARGDRWWPVPRALAERLAPWLAAPPPLDDTFVIRSDLGAPFLRWLVRVWEDHLNQPLNSAEFMEKTFFTPHG